MFAAIAGVHLGVDDDDVAHCILPIQRCSQPSADILAAGQHVVQTAEADVVAPAVTAEDPLALLDEAVRKYGCRCVIHYYLQCKY